jgi:hypothetical protein
MMPHQQRKQRLQGIVDTSGSGGGKKQRDDNDGNNWQQ